jgi:hypothetical protein
LIQDGENQMLTRHLNELFTRLERVVDSGAIEIRKNELLYWYDQDRFTVGVWRDVQAKWEELLEQLGEKSDTPLLVGDADGVWTFVWGEGLIPTEKAWFKDVRTLAKKKGEELQEEAA